MGSVGVAGNYRYNWDLINVRWTRKHVRNVAHAFHTTSGDNIFIAGEDALRGKHDRLHSAGTDLIDGGSIGSMLHPGRERNLASW